MESEKILAKEKMKVVKINGIKTTIVIPPKINKKDIPKEFKSEQNRPKGLVLLL